MMERSDPYPPVERWVLPAAACAVTLEAVALSGRAGREAGAFWLGSRSTVAQIEAVLLPRGLGVEESPYFWRVGASVYGAASRWAKPRGLSLLAIIHSHLPGVPPQLSWSDRHRSLQVPGALAAVVGNGGEDRNPADWGWYVYERYGYRMMESNEFGRRIVIESTLHVEVWQVDTSGVRTWNGDTDR